ncbi:ATP-binding cassette domain-containing protein [Microbacterium sediminicola]|uniref:ATP-binding cassette domain-containing protein n=1 Tax=Microbacterium sediminicola TaxID=415210 RepID=A0ABP4UFT6_9MICO
MTLPAPDAGHAHDASAAPLLRLHEVGIMHEGEDTRVPAHVSFTVTAGDVVLLLGPSGSGKSTLSLAMNGLIPHAIPATLDGRIEVGGRDTATHTVAQLSTGVGMVFQDPDAQLVTGTLLDEVAFGPENLRLPVETVLRRSEDALRRVGLWERRGENPDRLSGGGRQRLAIACALAMGSPVLVLDEPTANLDPAGIEDVYAALDDLVAAGDRAIVLIEHNLDAAIGFVNRVVVLDHDGVVIADGGVDDILRGRAGELHELGVWLPVSTLAALRLRGAGYALDPLPLTPDELRDALAREAPGQTSSPDPAPAAAATGTAPREGRRYREGRTDTPLQSPTPAISPTLPRGAGAGRAAGLEAPLIDIRHLSLRRKKTTVLQDVSLEVARGEFVAIVGANGAGKTTLLQSMAGVLRPPKGAVHVGGMDVARADDRQLSAHIGFVFQNPEHQFIAHTVFDEVAHGLRRQGLDDEQVRGRAGAILARFGLADRQHVHPYLLSGGQKRRLSVGTALVAGAPVLALDEPTFGQDHARAEELLTLLSELNDEGTTIIVVTHDMQLVADHARRVVVVDDGRIVGDGPTAEVFADAELLARGALRTPPLTSALSGLTEHPGLAGIARLSDLPGGTA